MWSVLWIVDLSEIQELLQWQDCVSCLLIDVFVMLRHLIN